MTEMQNDPPFGELRGWTLTFSEQGIERAYRYAQERNEGKVGFRHTYVPEDANTEKYLLWGNFLGVVSEAVFETRYRNLGARADWKRYERRGDLGYDFLIGDCRVQMRGVDKPTKRLSWEVDREINFDVMGLVCYEKREHLGVVTRKATLLRWCTADEIKAAPAQRIKGAPLHLLENGHAHKMAELTPFLAGFRKDQAELTLG